MRRLLAGYLFAYVLICLTAAFARAQASGQVLRIGFDNAYRPDCWCPMLVQLTSQTADTRRFQIQVVQEDMDADRASYASGDLVLEGNHEGQPATVSNYWIYFIPKPTAGGLPDNSTGTGGTLADLQAQLTVYLCDENGKHLSQLPITTTIRNVDPVRDQTDTARSRKLVLLISDGLDSPRLPKPMDRSLYGQLEDIETVAVDPRGNDLPGNVIGYDAVDTIIWMDADASPLAQGTNRSLDAIREWVRQGGRLIVCQPAQAFKLNAMADLLPVKSSKTEGFDLKIELSSDLSVFRRLVTSRKRSLSIEHDRSYDVAWADDAAPLAVARAIPTDDAFVDEWLEWPTSDAALGNRSPFIARRSYGTGSVTWVARDLGNRALTGPRREGWPMIWDRVFGSDNATDGEGVSKDPDKARLDAAFGSGSGYDLGKSILGLLEANRRTAYYVGLACLFFMIYWAIACPGVLLFLSYRKKPEWSWFAFAITALGGTAVTALLVKAVLRGPPEINHLTTVRQSTLGPSVAMSRFGMYIPRDGYQNITLSGIEQRPPLASYITPFSINPQFIANRDEPTIAYQDYLVHVTDGSVAPQVAVPYRSTLKKLQARWIGKLQGQIETEAGSNGPELTDPQGNYIRGRLVNHTGASLSNVYLAFRHPGSVQDASVKSVADRVYLISAGDWEKDKPLDLSMLMKRENRLNFEPLDGVPAHTPEHDQVAYAPLGSDNVPAVWERLWYRQLHGTSELSLQSTLPLLCFYELLSPMSSIPNSSSDPIPRFELYHRNARDFDISAPVVAGDLVIVGTVENAQLPIGLEVDGVKAAGTGTTLYENVIPLNRKAMYSLSATTQPAAVQ